MLRKNIVCESKPWLSDFKRCLLLLKVHTLPFPPLRLLFAFLYFAKTFLSCFSYPFCYIGFTGVSLSTLQPDDDPLMTAVNLLEANWISIQEIFELVSRVLTWMFVRLWLKQKAEVPKNDVKKLAKAFDTTDEPVLQLKGLSLKRGAEGAIALSYAHDGDFDWEKVSSPHGRTHSELKSFFEKAKKFVPPIVSIISPSAASAASVAPPSSTPVMADSMPPSTSGAEGTTPSSATEQNAEVA
jgi:hypothetical protein